MASVVRTVAQAPGPKSKPSRSNRRRRTKNTMEVDANVPVKESPLESPPYKSMPCEFEAVASSPVVSPSPGCDKEQTGSPKQLSPARTPPTRPRPTPPSLDDEIGFEDPEDAARHLQEAAQKLRRSAERAAADDAEGSESEWDVVDLEDDSSQPTPPRQRPGRPPLPAVMWKDLDRMLMSQVFKPVDRSLGSFARWADGRVDNVHGQLGQVASSRVVAQAKQLPSVGPQWVKGKVSSILK